MYLKPSYFSDTLILAILASALQIAKSSNSTCLLWLLVKMLQKPSISSPPMQKLSCKMQQVATIITCNTIYNSKCFSFRNNTTHVSSMGSTCKWSLLGTVDKCPGYIEVLSINNHDTHLLWLSLCLQHNLLSTWPPVRVLSSLKTLKSPLGFKWPYRCMLI